MFDPSQLPSVIVAIAGVIVIALVFVDALTTTLIVSEGAGPITKRLVGTFWRLTLAVRRPGCGSRLHALAGTTTLLATLLMWVVLLWTGWALVFLSEPGSIVNSTTREPAGFSDTWYFVGFSLFTLGTGDIIGSSAGWRLISAGTSFSGLFVITLAITYLLSVISAVVRRRSVASHVSSLGRTGADIVMTGWEGERFSAAFEQHLVALTSEIGDVTEQHMAYPVLHVLHAPDAEVAMSLRMAELNDAIILITCGLEPASQPDRAAWQPIKQSIDRYIDTVAQRTRVREGAPPPVIEVDTIRAAGLPVVRTAQFENLVGNHRASRQSLAGIVHAAGWHWVGSTHR